MLLVCESLKIFFKDNVLKEKEAKKVILTRGKFRRTGNNMIWNAIPHCLMWRIWCERNARTFEGQEKLVHDLKLSLLKSLFEWMNASYIFSFDTMIL